MEYPNINISDVDERYHPTGYGRTPVPEHYGAIETGGDNQKHRVPRPKRTRPHVCRQTAKPVSGPVSESNLGDPNEFLLTSDIRQLEHQHFENTVQTTSNSPDTPSTDFRESFDKLLGKIPSIRKRKRTLILQHAPGSEAVDARPRAKIVVSPSRLVHS